MAKANYKPGVGCDIGTSNIVVSRQKIDGTFENRYHRNMLYQLDVSDEATDLLQRSDYLYVQVGNIYYVVGEDALRLVNAIGRGEIIRPMKDGILNPSLKESSELLFYIIKAVVGDPIVENESLRFTIPANPVDKNLDNLFHQMLLNSFFTKMGYDAKPINEAMAIIYDCNPVTKDGTQLTGIGLSCGAGMSNCALSMKGLELMSFSITKSGDYIDEMVSKVTGTQSNRIVTIKEKTLDLNVDNSGDRNLMALSIYYEETIDRVLNWISKEFSKSNSTFDSPIEIIVAGGTSMPKGYCEIFEKCLKKYKFPFEIYRVRHSETPFYSVANGTCLRALADQNKKK